MSLCCKLLKVMHSKHTVSLTGMHDRQGLDGFLVRGNSSDKDSFDLTEYLDCFLMLIKH